MIDQRYRRSMLLVGCRRADRADAIKDVLDFQVETPCSHYCFTKNLQRLRFLFPCYIGKSARKEIAGHILRVLRRIDADPVEVKWCERGDIQDFLEALSSSLDPQDVTHHNEHSEDS